MIQYLLLQAGLALIVYGLYKYITLNNDYFEIRGVPHLKPSFLLGNSASFFDKNISLYEMASKLYNDFPSKKIFGLFDFRQPFLIVRDPEVIKQLAIKDFDHFEDHRPFIDDKADKLFGNVLFFLNGEKWRDMRATLSPAFTGSKMRQMFVLVSDCANEMSKHFISKAKGGERVHCEMKDLFCRYTNDVIATSAFGIKINSFNETENEFFKAGQFFMNMNNLVFMFKFIILKIAPLLIRPLGIKFLNKRIANFFRSMVLDTMEVREREGIFRPDMINILMQVKKGNQHIQNSVQEEKLTDGFATVEESSIGKLNVKRQWNDDEIVAQCFQFFLAGFETSSTLLSFLSYELATNPDIQQKLYQEIHETYQEIEGKQLDYNSLQKMKYMDMVISETLRKWPPLAFIDRVCTKDYNYDDGDVKFKIEKGVFLWFPVYGFHFDSKYFSNPDKFDPERYNDSNINKIIPGTYMPFGVGPRNCIGSRFALMEIKAVIYYMLLNFRFILNERTQVPLKLVKFGFGMKTEKGIHLELQLRN